MLGFLKRWRRRRLLAHERVPEREWRAAVRHVPAVQGLSSDELARLRDLVVLFLHEKRFEGVGGFRLTDEVRLVIAIQACLPILELGIDAYRLFTSIYVYPAAYRTNEEWQGEDGIVTVDGDARLGEAMPRGPVVISWEDAKAGMAWPEDGVNVVIHEFAHQLDMLDGDANGMPPLHPGQDREAWRRDFQDAYDAFCQAVADDEYTVIDSYAAEDPAEFFAVLSEAFFEIPGEVALEWPQLYRHLVRFYRQDPPRRRSGPDAV